MDEKQQRKRSLIIAWGLALFAMLVFLSSYRIWQNLLAASSQ
jgi:hypothetical protein